MILKPVCDLCRLHKFITVTFYFLLSTFYAHAQDSIRISGQLQNNTRFAKVVVKKFGTGVFDIAAIPISKETGAFSITAPMDIEPGIYRFQYSQSELSGYLDIIIDGKENEIEFALDLDDKALLPVFKSSTENKIWYAYKNEHNLLLQKMQLIGQFINEYPNVEDAIFKQVSKAYNNEIKNYNTRRNLFLANNKATWAAEMVANSPFIFTNPKDDIRIQDYYKNENYWNGINTSNPKLINTPLYTEHILNYLQYYMNPEMDFSEEEMNAGFIKSVDTIIQKFSDNEATKQFALKYLQLGFKEIGNEKVLQYIDQKYQHIIEQCNDNTAEKSEFEKRMAGYQAMKIGSQAPNITFTNNSTLYDIQSEQTLVVFWASWCPHCMEELPKINTWAAEHTNTKVVAISLDDDQTAYETVIKEHQNLMHNTDLKRWEGKAVNDYYIYGTPTLVLLDKDRKIMGKFSSFNELEKVLK